MIQENSIKRIPEIDALRALSVIGVLLFHFFPQTFPNGFLGVDAFFVISGFVVTRTYARSATNGFVGFVKSFYQRRFWRIFPSLAVVTVIGMVLVSMFDPVSDQSTRTGLFGLAGLANIELFRGHESYFTEQAGSNAFTHLWSLGVEEQFYVLFPPLLYAVLRSKRRIIAIGILAIPTSISLIAYLWFTERGSVNASFYLLPFRFWEIGCGALLSLILGSRLSESFRFAKLIGALLFLFCLFLATSIATTIATIAIVVATALLILGTLTPTNHHQRLVKMFATIGRRAYSLYLTHWVVLVVFRLTVGTDDGRILLAIVATVAISEVNHRLVELRFMRLNTQPLRSTQFARFFAACTLLVGVMLSVNGQNLYAGHSRDAGANIERQSCNDESSGRWLVGDSHADRYANILGTYFSGKCLQLRDSTTGYGFLIDLDGGEIRNVVFRDPTDFVARVREFRPHEIWISNYLQGFFQDSELLRRSADWSIGSYNISDKSRTIDNEYAFEYLLSLYKVILHEANQLGTRVFIELPPPDFDWIGEGGLMWRDEVSMCAANWFSPNRQSEFQEVCDFYKTPSQVSRDEVERRRSLIVDGLQRLTLEFGNLTLIDPLEVLCSATVCSTHRDGIRLFEDDDHYSVAGELLMAARLAEFVG